MQTMCRFTLRRSGPSGGARCDFGAAVAIPRRFRRTAHGGATLATPKRMNKRDGQTERTGQRSDVKRTSARATDRTKQGQPARAAEERDPERPSVEELGGESEHTLRLSGGGERDGEYARGGPRQEDDLSVDPEDLGRHFLQEATEDTTPFSQDVTEPYGAATPDSFAEDDERGEVLEAPDGTTTDQELLVDRRDDDGTDRRKRGAAGTEQRRSQRYSDR